MPMAYFKENYNFQGSRVAPTFFPGGGGGGPFFKGGGGVRVQLLKPYRNPKKLVFFKEVRAPPPLSGSAHAIFGSTGYCDKS